jgi:hypothetical protein
MTETDAGALELFRLERGTTVVALGPQDGPALQR